MVAPTSNIGLQSAHRVMQCDSVGQLEKISAIHVLEQWPRLSFYEGEGVSNLASDWNENLFIYVSIYLPVYMSYVVHETLCPWTSPFQIVSLTLHINLHSLISETRMSSYPGFEKPVFATWRTQKAKTACLHRTSDSWQLQIACACTASAEWHKHGCSNKSILLLERRRRWVLFFSVRPFVLVYNSV